METANPVDILVVGGGVNGAGVARDAAGRGLSVRLCEQGDLAGGTSSASSKLIHGGLRYLEHYEFRLVREALAEREVLLAAAPHLIRPLRFVLPHRSGLRPAWMLRAGLFVYDHLSRRRALPGTRTLLLRKAPAGLPLKPRMRIGFEYSDAWVDDARLVVLAALDAAERGARISPRTRLAGGRREGDLWRVELEHADGYETVLARAVVNAAGPWADAALRRLGVAGQARHLKLVKGSHIVLPSLYEGEHAYTLQSPDGRVVFCVPYEGRFTLVGTTDVPFEGDPADVRPSPEEIDYLCAAVGEYFARPAAPAQVVWAYAGVRPLYDDGAVQASAVSRDYVFDLDAPAGEAPLLSVFGGKITTFRRLAEHALDRLQPLLGNHAPAWTGAAHLPGGDLPDGDFAAFHDDARRRLPWIPAPVLTRLCHAYGTRLERVIDGAGSWPAMGKDYGAGLTEREVRYLVETEWAAAPDDVLWRRTKAGLHMSDAERAAFVADWPAATPLAASGEPR